MVVGRRCSGRLRITVCFSSRMESGSFCSASALWGRSCGIGLNGQVPVSAIDPLGVASVRFRIDGRSWEDTALDTSRRVQLQIDYADAGGNADQRVMDALLDVDKAVAFHVWCEGLEPRAARDVEALIETFPGGVALGRDEETDEDECRASDAFGDAFVRGAGADAFYPERHPETQDPVVPLRRGSRRARIRPASSRKLATQTKPVDPEAARADPNENAAPGSDGFPPDEKENETSASHGWRRREHVNPPRLRAGRGSGKLALVFGREVEGLTDWEVNACDAMCAIPTGRLIESLSVSHAAVIILSQYYQSRRERRSAEG